MHKNREGYLISDTHRECTSCGRIFEKTSKTVALCPKCNSNRVKSQKLEKKIFNRARSRAIKKGIPFDITYSDIILPEVCPILGIPLKENKGKPGAYRDSYSIDRIIPELGYIKGNIQIISQLANGMKNNATEEELITFAKYILNHYNSGTA